LKTPVLTILLLAITVFSNPLIESVYYPGERQNGDTTSICGSIIVVNAELNITSSVVIASQLTFLNNLTDAIIYLFNLNSTKNYTLLIYWFEYEKSIVLQLYSRDMCPSMDVVNDILLNTVFYLKTNGNILLHPYYTIQQFDGSITQYTGIVEEYLAHVFPGDLPVLPINPDVYESPITIVTSTVIEYHSSFEPLYTQPPLGVATGVAGNNSVESSSTSEEVSKISGSPGNTLDARSFYNLIVSFILALIISTIIYFIVEKS